jgi:lipoprotein-anchoring transpeptidase ErfK/SrfK
VKPRHAIVPLLALSASCSRGEPGTPSPSATAEARATVAITASAAPTAPPATASAAAATPPPGVGPAVVAPPIPPLEMGMMDHVLPAGPEDRWIDVSLSQGTLTLFVGRNAVYSTLMSPGAGGVTPSPKITTDELVGAALTPLGSYRIWFKHRAARMTSEATNDPEAFWIADVPWIQYFRPPFAIHAAYWHEDFGQPKIGGCVNLSPEDAKVVFDWTYPQVPDGWTGRIARKGERATRVVIRR